MEKALPKHVCIIIKNCRVFEFYFSIVSRAITDKSRLPSPRIADQSEGSIYLIQLGRVTQSSVAVFQILLTSRVYHRRVQNISQCQYQSIAFLLVDSAIRQPYLAQRC